MLFKQAPGPSSGSHHKSLARWLQFISLCLLVMVSAPLLARDTVSIGYLPVLPMSQLFVIQGEGWAAKDGIDIRLTPFAEGPGIVQALVKGELDAAYIGIGPALIARSKGVDIQVVASNVVEQVALVARGDLALYMVRDAREGLVAFTSKMHRKPRIASFAKGSVPDTVLRYWLLKVAKLPEDSVEYVSLGAPELQQALLKGEVDGASILEPILTMILTKDKTATVVVAGNEMMPNMPGAVVAVRREFIQRKPKVVAALVKMHKHATEFIIRDPARAATDIFGVIGKGPLTADVIDRAITSPYAKYVSDPYRIMTSTNVMHDFLRETGQLSKPVSIRDAFDLRFYNEEMGR